MTDLTAKIALVTGASRGIGRAVAECLQSRGAKVIASGRGERPSDFGTEIDWCQCDITSVEGVATLKNHILSKHGGLNILVNNAGMQIEKTVLDTTDEEFDALMAVNTKAVFVLTRTFIPVMSQSGGGSIINLGSISGHVSDPEMAIYNASKAFVHGLTRSVATDHGKDGIRCNAICPGWIMTEMAQAGFALAKDPERAMQDALARHSVGRFGKPDDIGKTVCWLASDDAAYVTGQTFTIDGGLTAASPLNPGLF